MPESRIIRKGETFLLEIAGERLPLYGYLSYQPEKACYEDFKQAGIRLFFCTVYAGDRGINQLSGIRPFRSGFWKGYGQYDFYEVEEDFKRIAGNSVPGEIYIIPRFMVEVPSWWDAINPGELCRDAHGTPLHQSFSSEKWLRDIEQVFIDFRKWLESSGWDRYIAGWHLAAGNTEEFLRPSHRAGQMSDYSQPAQNAFRNWIREKYHNRIENLNKAWNREYSLFDQIMIPSPAKRLFAVSGDIRDDQFEQETIDYYTFMNESVAKAVVKLCSAAKRVTGKKQVIGAFYGYLAGGTESGQHAARIVYESTDVDFIASPFIYTDNRAQGIDWQLQGSADSAALHGKPWFAEADIRTFLSRPISQSMKKADPYVCRAYDGPVWWGPDTAEGSLGQMLKGFSRVLTNNNAIWWFDMWGGWYHDERLMVFQKKAFDIYRQHALSGGSPNAGEIALFMDDALFTRIKPTGALASLQNHQLWKAMGFVGAPYRMYMLDDLINLDPAQFRMAIFSSACDWTEDRLNALSSWKSEGRVLSFLGPVICESATGVGLEKYPQSERPVRKITAGQKKAQNDEALYFSTKAGSQTTPDMLVPVQRWKALPGDVIMESDELGPQALLRRYPDYSVYVDTVSVPEPGRIRELLNAAGGQLYTCENDIVYASRTHIAVHAATDGIKRIHIPGKGVLVNEMTGQTLPGNESFVDVSMKMGETLLLRIVSEETD